MELSLLWTHIISYTWGHARGYASGLARVSGLLGLNAVVWELFVIISTFMSVYISHFRRKLGIYNLCITLSETSNVSFCEVFSLIRVKTKWRGEGDFPCQLHHSGMVALIALRRVWCVHAWLALRASGPRRWRQVHKQPELIDWFSEWKCLPEVNQLCAPLGPCLGWGPALASWTANSVCLERLHAAATVTKTPN